MRVTVVNFSGRERGNCSAISRVVMDAHASDEARCCHMGALPVHPCGGCAYECFGREKPCPYQEDGVYEIYARVTSSHLAYFVVPNYCDYPNANFFLFNERSQCFFQHRGELLDRYLAVPKKFIVVSNTGRENFTRAFQYQVSEGERPSILFLSAKKYGKVSLAGDLMSSAEAKEEVARFCGGGRAAKSEGEYAGI